MRTQCPNCYTSNNNQLITNVDNGYDGVTCSNDDCSVKYFNGNKSIYWSEIDISKLENLGWRKVSK